MSVTPQSQQRPDWPAVREVAAQWVARRDAGLTPAEERAFQRWLENDPAHAAAIAQCESAWGALDQPYLTGASEKFLRSIAARRSRRRRRRLAGVAAVAMLVLGAGTLVRIRDSTTATPGTTPRETQTAVVHFPRAETLPDGSTVEFKAGTVYTLEFRPDVRRVRMNRGEAHFQVQPDATRPFVVEAGAIAVEALGTAFTVQLAGRTVEVLVTEGRVAVETSTDSSAIRNAKPRGTLATLGAGHKARVEQTSSARPQAEVTSMPEAELSERMAWRAPRLEFTSTPLSEAVALLNEHGGAGRGSRFVIADAELATVRVGGLFRADNTDAFIQLLRTGFGIEVEKDGTEMILRKSR